MTENLIEGLIVTPLKQISLEKGDVYHGLKQSETSFKGFAESYYSFIKYKQIKAWKRHKEMICNIVVPFGIVEFVLYDDRLNSKTISNINTIILGPDNYLRITIPPGIWYGFRGLVKEESLVHNIADIEHDPLEQENIAIDSERIPYTWSKF